MNQPTAMTSSSVILGLDLGDRTTHFCALRDRKVVARGKFATNLEGLKRGLAEFPGARIALEAGSQSPWISRFLADRGFDVHVVDPRRVLLIAKDPRKTDRRDAEMLARLEAGMPEILGDVKHRSEQAQADLALIRCRDQLVRARTGFVQAVRGTCKSFGVRLPSGSTAAFANRVAELVPDCLLPAVRCILAQISGLTSAIRELDGRIEQLAEERYPEIVLLQQVCGVGKITATAFVLTIEDPKRFEDSRKVASWLGLCPRVCASGDSDPQLPISKAGDPYLRRLLIQAAHYILGPFGQDCDLRSFGLKLVQPGSSASKRKAVTAVARKLAVLLHRIWSTGLVYDPLHETKRREERAAV